MKKRSIFIILSMLLVIAILPMFNAAKVSASDPIVSGQLYKLINPNSGKALTVFGGGTADGTNVEIRTDSGNDSQKWQVNSNSDGTYTLINPKSGKALNVHSGLTANGTNVEIWTSSGIGAQKWQISSNSDGSVKLLNPNSGGKALDVEGANTGDGVNVQIWESTGSIAQKWQLVSIVTPSGGPTGYTFCANENQTCSFTGTRSIAYGANGTFNYKNLTTSTPCTNAVFGDPLVGIGKACYYSNSTSGTETIGGGSISNPAVGPAPSSSIGGSGFVLVKNWNFGTSGTIKSIADMSSEFYYHDNFNTIGNGTNYGAITLAPDAANAISGQPIEDPNHKVREITGDSLKTYLVPLNGATTVDPNLHNAGNGSFMAKFSLPNGGSLLGRDILWETRVKYVTPKYFWFALWNVGNIWHGGAELDLQESFGYDNGGGNTNFDGRYWHSGPVGGTETKNYSDWGAAMSSLGINNFNAATYHTYTSLYRKDNTYSHYMDGIEIQSGTINWVDANWGSPGGAPIDYHFLVDAGWGHTQVGSVNHAMPASEFNGKYYEFDYSRVYLR